MVKTSIEKLAADIGFDIGMSDDKVQADLLNGFAKALWNSMGIDNIGGQLTYIVNSLEPKTESIFIELAELIKLKQQEK